MNTSPFSSNSMNIELLHSDIVTSLKRSHTLTHHTQNLFAQRGEGDLFPNSDTQAQLMDEGVFARSSRVFTE